MLGWGVGLSLRRGCKKSCLVDALSFSLALIDSLFIKTSSVRCCDDVGLKGEYIHIYQKYSFNGGSLGSCIDEERSKVR